MKKILLTGLLLLGLANILAAENTGDYPGFIVLGEYVGEQYSDMSVTFSETYVIFNNGNKDYWFHISDAKVEKKSPLTIFISEYFPEEDVELTLVINGTKKYGKNARLYLSLLSTTGIRAVDLGFISLAGQDEE